jgi:hypothetical protein
MRIALAAAFTVAALLFSGNPSHAGEGPWCALISLGTSSMYEDCQYWSFEQCRPVVLAGNRGFCNPNPRFVANQPGYAPTGKRKRHAQSY